MSPWTAAVNTHLENLKTVNVQYSDVELLMVFHHGFVDGLKSKGTSVRTWGVHSDQSCVTCARRGLWPPRGSQTPGSAAPWRGRPECNRPAPRSASRRWTPPRCPTCCPSCGSSVSPSDDSAGCRAGMQGRLELDVGEAEKSIFYYFSMFVSATETVCMSVYMFIASFLCAVTIKAFKFF